VITDAALAAPFEQAEFASREDRLLRAIDRDGLAALIVTVPENIYYLTGFSTPAYYSAQALLVQPGKSIVLYVYASEAEGVAQTTYLEQVESYGPEDDPWLLFADLLRRRGLAGKRVGLELRSPFFNVAAFEKLRAAAGLDPVESSAMLEQQRMVKSDAEVGYIREAARVASEAMRAVADTIHAGATESDMAAAAYAASIQAGGEFPGSPPYISTGWRTTLPHASWTTRRIDAGDLAYTELSGCVRRYSAALMRTFTLGDLAPVLERLEQATIAGLDAAIAALRPGATSASVDAACRDRLRAEGFEYPHETGYSIGVAYPPGWNETHVFNLKPNDTREVQANMTFHLVPHVIVPGVGTVGLSETVLVGESGAEVLTDFPRRVMRLKP